LFHFAKLAERREKVFQTNIELFDTLFKATDYQNHSTDAILIPLDR